MYMSRGRLSDLGALSKFQPQHNNYILFYA